MAILDSESKAEYEELLAGLRENLATRRGARTSTGGKAGDHSVALPAPAFSGERGNTEEYGICRIGSARSGARSGGNALSGLLCGRGLIRNTHNRHALEQCLEWLAHLRKGIEEVGFRPDQDAVFLKSLYGNRDPSRLGTDLYDSYETLLQIAETPEEERERKRYPSPSECRQIVMDKIDKEIRRIKRDQKARSSVQAARTQLEIVSRNVPDGPGLDRLLRYETSLDRSFDRTLSQLERLQRVRLGQPVLPKLEVHHSVS